VQMRRPALHRVLTVIVLVAVLSGAAVAGLAGGPAVDPAASGTADVVPDSGAPAVTGVADNRSAHVSFGELDPDDDGTLVTVESVGLSDGGFVTVRKESATGALVGVSKYLPAGTHADVLLRVQEPVRRGRTYVVVVHRDTDGDATFDWETSGGEEDVPYTDGEGRPVADRALWNPNPTGGEPLSPTATATPTPTTTPTATEEPIDCTGAPAYVADCAGTPTTAAARSGHWTRLLGPLLAFLAVATAGLLAVGALLARWRLAPGEEP
jgi:hypothetical protein